MRGGTKINKIQIIPTREKIVTTIKKSILAGSLTPGSELTQEKIANELGVSRMPVREALIILEKDGFVSQDKGRRYIVTKLTLDDIYEHYEVRALLEGNTAFRAAQSKPDMTKLNDALQKMDDAKDASSYAEYNQLFHEEIWSMSRSPKHSELIVLLWNRIPHVVVADNEEHRAKAQEEHREIADAISKGDSARARDAMKAHILRSMTDYIERIELKKS